MLGRNDQDSILSQYVALFASLKPHASGILVAFCANFIPLCKDCGDNLKRQNDELRRQRDEAQELAQERAQELAALNREAN